MTLTGGKLRAVVNLLADPLQSHAAAHALAVAAKERGVLVADLIQEALAPPPQTPTLADVDDGLSAIGRRIDEDHYGLRSFIKRQTDKAWLVERPPGGRVPASAPMWLAKSPCQHHCKDATGRAIIVIPTWLARKHDLL
jgi:hypothetical protein